MFDHAGRGRSITVRGRFMGPETIHLHSSMHPETRRGMVKPSMRAWVMEKPGRRLSARPAAGRRELKSADEQRDRRGIADLKARYRYRRVTTRRAEMRVSSASETRNELAVHPP